MAAFRWFEPPALVGEANPAVELKLQALESKAPLNLTTVREVVDGLRHPERLRDELAHALRYAQRVEAEVAGLSIQVLLAHASEPDDFVGRFVELWVPDELTHAAALELLLERLELEPYEPGADSESVPFHNRAVGVLAKRMPRAYEMVSLAYHTIGAVNERLALAAYSRMSEVCGDLGENDLTDALFSTLRRDESVHLGYYRTHARQLRSRLRPWQRRAVRATVSRTYAPVGAGKARDKAAFGRALIDLDEDPDDPGIARAVHEIASELFGEPDSEVPPFVLDAMRACVERARREGVSPDA